MKWLLAFATFVLEKEAKNHTKNNFQDCYALTERNDVKWMVISHVCPYPENYVLHATI